MVLLCLAGLQGVPQELTEAAQVDGAGPWQTLWRIIMPAIGDTLAVAAILRAMEAFELFAEPYVMTGGGPGNATDTLSLHIYKTAFTFFDMGYAGAMVVVSVGMLVVLYGAYLRLSPQAGLMRPGLMRPTLLTLAVLTLLAFTVLPLAYLVLTSLKPDDMLLAQPPVLWFRPVLDHYTQLLSDGDFPRYYRNSIEVATGGTVCAVLLGSLMAFAFAHVPFRGRGFAFFLVLLPRTFPPVTTIIPIFFVVRTLGMMDQIGTLILFETAARLPLVVWVMRGFLRTIPGELIEASLLDGCRVIGSFFRVVVPLAAPGLAAVALISFIDIWNGFLIPLVLTNFNAVTAPVGMMSYATSDEQVVWGIIAAGATLTVAPVLLLAFTLNRFLLRGLTAGAIK